MIFNLHLTFSPQWENVSNIRSFVSQMLSSGIVNLNDAEKIATASSTLVENAVKYSAAGSAVIDIKQETELGKIHLAIKNISDQANLDTFETVYKQVNEADAKENIATARSQSFNSPRSGHKGLARIRYECQGDIRYSISENIHAIPDISAFTIARNNYKLLNISVIIPLESLACNSEAQRGVS